jgi:hypothetical protein
MYAVANIFRFNDLVAEFQENGPADKPLEPAALQLRSP